MTDIQEVTTLADTAPVEPAAAAAAASASDAAAASAAAGPSSEGNGIKPPTDGDEVDAKIDKVRSEDTPETPPIEAGPHSLHSLPASPLRRASSLPTSAPLRRRVSSD